MQKKKIKTYIKHQVLRRFMHNVCICGWGWREGLFLDDNSLCFLKSHYDRNHEQTPGKNNLNIISHENKNKDQGLIISSQNISPSRVSNFYKEYEFLVATLFLPFPHQVSLGSLSDLSPPLLDQINNSVYVPYQLKD